MTPLHSASVKREPLEPGRASNTGVDDEERQALRAEGLDPDDPEVITAIDIVLGELSLLSGDDGTTDPHQ